MRGYYKCKTIIIKNRSKNKFNKNEIIKFILFSAFHKLI